jgi:hypothetical protein
MSQNWILIREWWEEKLLFCRFLERISIAYLVQWIGDSHPLDIYPVLRGIQQMVSDEEMKASCEVTSHLPNWEATIKTWDHVSRQFFQALHTQWLTRPSPRNSRAKFTERKWMISRLMPWRSTYKNSSNHSQLGKRSHRVKFAQLHQILTSLQQADVFF